MLTTVVDVLFSSLVDGYYSIAEIGTIKLITIAIHIALANFGT